MIVAVVGLLLILVAIMPLSTSLFYLIHFFGGAFYMFAVCIWDVFTKYACLLCSGCTTWYSFFCC